MQLLLLMSRYPATRVFFAILLNIRNINIPGQELQGSLMYPALRVPAPANYPNLAMKAHINGPQGVLKLPTRHSTMLGLGLKIENAHTLAWNYYVAGCYVLSFSGTPCDLRSLSINRELGAGPNQRGCFHKTRVGMSCCLCHLLRPCIQALSRPQQAKLSFRKMYFGSPHFGEGGSAAV